MSSKATQSAVKLKRKIVWKESDEIYRINLPFQSDDDNDDENGLLDPVRYIKNFLSDQLLELLVDESNKYVAKKSIEKVLSLNENEFNSSLICYTW